MKSFSINGLLIVQKIEKNSLILLSFESFRRVSCFLFIYFFKLLIEISQHYNRKKNLKILKNNTYSKKI